MRKCIICNNGVLLRTCYLVLMIFSGFILFVSPSSSSSKNLQISSIPPADIKLIYWKYLHFCQSLSKWWGKQERNGIKNTPKMKTNSRFQQINFVFATPNFMISQKVATVMKMCYQSYLRIRFIVERKNCSLRLYKIARWRTFCFNPLANGWVHVQSISILCTLNILTDAKTRGDSAIKISVFRCG